MASAGAPDVTAQAAEHNPLVVRTADGALTGAPGVDSSIRVFKGIPYAAPPVGDLRWKSPQPVTPWTGLRRADQFAASCMQPPRTGISALLPTAPRLASPDEDCLYLNVWTPASVASAAPGARLPVMLYFPGGSFTTGGGSGLVFDGESLARKGVVLVTINYRLGVFGFFAHPELTAESGHQASGNYGLLDQLAAMQWVQKNIAAFGGDPSRVTIFGQSAGAISVLYQVVSPLGAGLFQRAIAQSGGLRSQPLTPLVVAEQAGVALAEKLGAASVADLRAKPAAELMTASPAGTGPILDTWVLRGEPDALIAANQYNGVPLLLGSNAEESNVLLRTTVNAEQYAEQARTQYGALSRIYLALYPGKTDEEAAASQKKAFDDRFAWGMWKWADLHAAQGGEAFLYYFTRRPPPDAPIPGAAHDAELYYVFRNLHLFEQAWTDWDASLADFMSWYWVNFARSGDPNGTSIFKWPPYDALDPAKKDDVLVFGGTIRLGKSRLDSTRRAFWDDLRTAALAPR